jgi:SAM-dependent methyltransferase
MKQHAPATARNRDPILEVLRRWLPPQGLVLEIAAGTGEHAVYFAGRLPALTWQPTDVSEAALASIAAWRREAGPANLLAPLRLDVCQPWPVGRADAIFCANMIHIAPWRCAQGLMAGAGTTLRPGGVLILYGPFRIGGEHTAPSNAAFDADLRARAPEWGVRDLEAVAALAQAAGLDHVDTIPMPANNLSVVWRRRALDE